MLEGACICGDILYRLNNSPLIVHCCHCLGCQKTTGSAFVVNAWIEQDEVKVLEGSPKSYPLLAGTGHDHVVSHCPNCYTDHNSNVF